MRYCTSKQMKKRKGYFSISAVAQMFSIHQQTIRLYEKEGLINPKRSEGNTRLFSEEDIDRLEEVIYLTHKMGINLAGVEMILKLQKQIKKLQGEMNSLFEATHRELEDDILETKQSLKAHAAQLAATTKKGASFGDNALERVKRTRRELAKISEGINDDTQ